jgi:hypothetical protein
VVCDKRAQGEDEGASARPLSRREFSFREYQVRSKLWLRFWPSQLRNVRVLNAVSQWVGIELSFADATPPAASNRLHPTRSFATLPSGFNARIDRAVLLFVPLHNFTFLGLLYHETKNGVFVPTVPTAEGVNEGTIAKSLRIA